jgi:hypothetical protein
VIKGILAQVEKYISIFLSLFLIFSSTYQLLIDEVRFFLLFQLELECHAYLWVDLKTFIILVFSFVNEDVLGLETELQVFDNYFLGFFFEVLEI